jgi:alpha-tubulin suppressor-like RCC1 family protein
MMESWKPRFSKERWGFIMLILWISILVVEPAQADSPIYQGLFWDAAPAVAYNSQRGEFLVVWNVLNPFFPPPDTRLFGPVMGQLIKESGEKVGDPFEIISSGAVLPKVAYNAQKNEYLVVAESNYNIVGQRISAFGLKVGGLNTYLTKARSPRVLYNSMAGNYLVSGAWWSESPPCTLQIYTCRVTASGQPYVGVRKVADENYNYCADGPIYALEYAPIPSGREALAWGRYLLAIGSPANMNLKMLDSAGFVLPVLYNPDTGDWQGENIPFQSLVGSAPYHIDIAYGAWGIYEKAFFLVWGDPGRKVPGNSQQVGIWGGIVPADKELYYTTDPVTNQIFPLGWQLSHLTDADSYKSWKPVVKFNQVAGTFVVAWRETPGTDPNDLTSVNHIRVNTSSSYGIPPKANLVVSSTTGTEDPKLPALAASSKTGAMLIAWEDYRNGWSDIYGTMFDATTRSTSGINPGSGGGLPVYSKMVSAGMTHSLGIRSDGSLWAWGDNDHGQLGIGEPLSEQHFPVPVSLGTVWSQVSAGGGHTMAIKSDGSLWAWGFNYWGGLGTGDPPVDHPSPVPVASGLPWSQVSAGGVHTLGIKSDGSLWAWGRNFEGQLGAGDHPINHPSPVPVVSGLPWARVSAGGYHTLGIKSDGSLWAFGSNRAGQLGTGDQTFDHDIPVPVASGLPWPLVSAGSIHTLGIKSDGSLWAWGRNIDGQLGTGEDPTVDHDIPVPVASGLPWAQVSAGWAHSLGIKSDGSLWGWGLGKNGQLGTGNPDPKSLPFQIGNDLDWISVSAGDDFSLGLRSDGCIYSWGKNDHGQLGLNDTIDRFIPTLISSSCLPSNPLTGYRIWLPLVMQ